MASGPSSGLTIVLLGNSSVGKSASGNTILGRKAFVSKRSFTSVTKEVSKETDSVFGKQISVQDTPGILKSEKEVTTLCQDLLKSKEPCLFLVVVKIDRFTDEQKNAVEAAIRVIGDEGFENCHLLFTSGDALNDMSLDDFINDDPESPLPSLVERFKGRYHVFNNENGGPEQVRHLLEKSGHLSDVVSDPPGDPRRMVLLGLPGEGKSASGNTILGSIQFESGCGLQGVSTEAVPKTATVEGRQVTVVDTPGFTDEDPEHLFREIMRSVAKADPGPHALIIVLRINRISEAEIKLFKNLPNLFVKDVRKHMMVLFTHGDDLHGQSIEDLIKDEGSVSDLVTMCAGRYSVFDNTKRGNRVQVKHLLDKMDEMVTANNGEHFISEMSTRVQMASEGGSEIVRTDYVYTIVQMLMQLVTIMNLRDGCSKLWMVVKGNSLTYRAHSDICSLLVTHPSTRSLVLGAMGNYCTVRRKQWDVRGVRWLAQWHHGRAGGEMGPLQVAVYTPYLGVWDLTRRLLSHYQKWTIKISLFPNPNQRNSLIRI